MPFEIALFTDEMSRAVALEESKLEIKVIKTSIWRSNFPTSKKKGARIRFFRMDFDG